jgi:exocyst complex component 2
MHAFQKHITTAAHKIASGVTDSSGSKTRQIPAQFSNKITKSFLDSLYSFLDGLVHLASDESPVVQGLQIQANVEETTGAAPLFDLKSNVSVSRQDKGFKTDVR